MAATREVGASVLTELLFDGADVALCVVAPDGGVVRVKPEWLRAAGSTLAEVDAPRSRCARAARARAIAENIRDHLLVMEARRDARGEVTDWVYVDANEGALALLGAARERLIGRTVRDVLGEGAAPLAERMARVIATGAPERYETADSGRNLLVTIFRVDPNAVGSAVVDVTDRRRTEAALRESEERARAHAAEVQKVLDQLEATFGSMTQGVMVYRPDGKCLRINAAAEKILGVPQAQLLAADGVEARMALLGMRTPEGAPFPACETPAWVALHGESSRNVEMVLHKKTGEATWLSSSGAPVRGADGLVHGAVVTFSDVTDEKRAEEALRQANEQLREAARRKDEFLGMLSHELRNPLAPIRNSIYILRHAQPGGAQAQRAREVIERQTEHLTRLVDELLDVTRIVRGKIELRRERVDLGDVVRRTAEDFRAILEGRGITILVEVARAKVWTDADATRVAQMIGNVLHNAAKYSRRGDRVTVTLGIDATEAEIRVRDTGAGIDPALLPHVFEPFVQGERTLARTEGGLGLGLALVKGIAELHGGKVRAESRGIGMGTTIIVRLPLPASSVVAGHTHEVARRTSRRRRVLVVDDNQDAAESLGEIAAMLGHTVEVVYDGPSALERARLNPPDVVLCDVGMPEMSGYDVARALRASLRKAVRLIAVTGYAQPDDIREALEAGFDRHVAKPASIDDVERLLADVVGAEPHAAGPRS